MSGDRHGSWPGLQAYADLDAANAAELAWEWLRRDAKFREAAPSIRHWTTSGALVIEAAPLECHRRWGILHVEDSGSIATDVPVLWAAEVDASVLRVDAVPIPRAEPGAFDINHWGAHAVVVTAPDLGEHLLLQQGSHHIRIHVGTGTVLEGPVSLRFAVNCTGRFEPPLETLRRFLCLQRDGCWLPGPLASERMRSRSIAALRVHDAIMMGASLRDIAVMLFGERRAAEDWRAPGEAMKSHCRRMVALARDLAGGGYRRLLP